LKAKYASALAFHFGVRPWEHDLMTYNQFAALCKACDEIAEKASE
jgi:hypothetical protein